MNEDPYMDTLAIAELVGITRESVRLYLRRSRRRLADGMELRPQDFPLPDLQVGRSPAWRRSSIEEWRRRRPGRGRTIDQPRHAA